jgi:hypothetical protein
MAKEKVAVMRVPSEPVKRPSSSRNSGIADAGIAATQALVRLTISITRFGNLKRLRRIAYDDFRSAR